LVPPAEQEQSRNTRGPYYDRGDLWLDIFDQFEGWKRIRLADFVTVVTPESASAEYFIKRDGTVDFTASQSMGGFTLTDVHEPSALHDAATKGYVDSKLQVNADFATHADFVTEDHPTGLIDGVNRIFTLTNTPLSGSVKLYVNGLRLTSGVDNDYTISGRTITLAWAPTVAKTTNFVADYSK
jgi:hypothetical protein